MKQLFFLLMIALLVSCNNTGNKQAVEKEAPMEEQPPAMEMTEITYRVEGMTCEGCENAVGKSVESLEGITSVESSHEEGWTRVMFNPDKTNPDDIRRRIGDAGYTVLGLEEDESDAPAKEESGKEESGEEAPANQ